MKPNPRSALIDDLIEPLSKCLTDESAQRLLRLRAGKKLQAKIDKLADKCTEGTLTDAEKHEYQDYVSFGNFVALLQSKARQRLANTSKD
jgi:hypothetical protein